jgi:predicted enzyme related to lactoylglutathione lyase
MTNPTGSFIWYELMTTDAVAAKAFYPGLLGWRISDDADYAHIEASEGMVGGILPLSPEMTQGGARPGWFAYVAVEDVDATVRAIEQRGGRVLMPARDMADVGRFALVADPHGAPFYVMTPQLPTDRPDAESNAFAADRPMLGHCAWNELSSSDPASAWSFYSDLFGWNKDGEMDMGELGKYEFIRHGPHMLGAIMPLMKGMPMSAWSFYFRVPDIDVAADYIKANGGTLFMEPVEIPGGEYSINASDQQGAAFGLVGPRV